MESVDSNPDDPDLHFRLGLRLWESGQDSNGKREKAAEHFLISAKLNPHSAAALKYLGHYYCGLSGADTQRAVKCYQRAVTRCPDDDESGEALCDLLDRGGMETLEVTTCREARLCRSMGKMMPAELFFQKYLLAQQSASEDSTSLVGTHTSPLKCLPCYSHGSDFFQMLKGFENA